MSTPKRRKRYSEKMKAAARGGKRISLAELKRRCAAQSLNERELKLYFVPDEAKSKPFDPAIKVNEKHVEIRGRAPSKEEARRLFDKATRKLQVQQPVEKPAANIAVVETRSLAPKMAKKAVVAANKVLAEGDSWFNLPPVLWPKDAIDHLHSDFDISNLAKWGDTLENILQQKQYLQKLKSGNFRHFLFSAGGNDVLGSIRSYVTSRNSGDTNPANAPNYVKSSFAQKVRSIIAGYEQLAAEVRGAVGSTVVLYVHGYANAIPVTGGDYLGKPLKDRGFDAVAHAALAQAVVAHMVKLFNDALRTFAATHAGTVYVDMRPALTAARDWSDDEIHPSSSGSSKVATRLRDAIRSNTPVA